MHKFIDNIVAFSLKNKFFIFLLYSNSRDSRSCLFQTYSDRRFSGRDKYESHNYYSMGGTQRGRSGEVYHNSH